MKIFLITQLPSYALKGSSLFYDIKQTAYGDTLLVFFFKSSSSFFFTLGKEKAGDTGHGRRSGGLCRHLPVPRRREVLPPVCVANPPPDDGRGDCSPFRRQVRFHGPPPRPASPARPAESLGPSLWQDVRQSSRAGCWL